MMNPNVGDSVRLKSGGPEMTVVEIITGLGDRPTGSVRCSWFAGKKNEKAVFPIGALEAANATQPSR